MRLNTVQKNVELQKYLTLVTATFNYLTLKFGRQYVCDDVATNEVMYNLQKGKAQTYFDERRLDKLKKMLKAETNWLMMTFDLAFENYIKTNTAYTIDIFEEARTEADEILKKGKIENDKESRHVGIMINLYEKTEGHNPQLKALQSLQHDFFERKSQSGEMQSKPKIQYEEHSETREWVEENGMMMEVISGTVTVWDGPKPKHFQERKEIAPNGKLKFTITESRQGKYASTTVMLIFPEAAIQCYNAEGIHPDINAFWKDNHTICIETLKQYTTLPKYKKVESYGNVVHIEYIEN